MRCSVLAAVQLWVIQNGDSRHGGAVVSPAPRATEERRAPARRQGSAQGKADLRDAVNALMLRNNRRKKRALRYGGAVVSPAPGVAKRRIRKLLLSPLVQSGRLHPHILSRIASQNRRRERPRSRRDVRTVCGARFWLPERILRFVESEDALAPHFVTARASRKSAMRLS